MEPLSVGVHSVSTLGKCKTDQVVIVFGAGPVGLLCMAVAKALGARRVIAVDIQKERLDFAKGYAATDIFIPVSFSIIRLDQADIVRRHEERKKRPMRTVAECPTLSSLRSTSPL